MKWRKWNNILHRDIGYLSVGLTIVYAVSGLAVNHVNDWNPNFVIERNTHAFPALVQLDPFRENLVPEILGTIGETREVKNMFRPDSFKIQLFFENKTILFDFKKGAYTTEQIKSRPILRALNFLHLNHAQRLWTYFADLYAVCLGFLAISGVFVLRGKNGLRGRGKWLITAGMVVPLLFLILYY